MSLNTLVVKPSGANIDLRDPTVDGGLDPGPCAPGEVTTTPTPGSSRPCAPPAGANRLRIDLGDREDSARRPGRPARRPCSAVPAPTSSRPPAATTRSPATTATTPSRPARAPTRSTRATATTTSTAARATTWSRPGWAWTRSAAARATTTCACATASPTRCAAGPATDKVEADTLDDVALDCEDVTRLPTAAPAAAGPPGATARRRACGSAARPIQRAGKGYRAKLVATSSERGTIAASGFMEIGDLSLPISTDRHRVGVGGGGVELTFKLTARENREAAKAWKRKRKVIAPARRRRRRPRRELHPASRRRRSAYFASRTVAARRRRVARGVEHAQLQRRLDRRAAEQPLERRLGEVEEHVRATGALERGVAVGHDRPELVLAGDGLRRVSSALTEHASEQRTLVAIPPRASRARCDEASLSVVYLGVRSVAEATGSVTVGGA